MQFKKYILLLMTPLIGLASCDLDEFPKDSESPESYFKSASELELYTNQFYMMEPDADAMYDEVSNMVIKGLAFSDLMVGSTRTVPASGGGWTWGNLRHINYYLQNSHRCSDAKARSEYDGLAYFWRAYFYFDKLRRFGDVPWYDEPLLSDQTDLLTKPRDSRDVIIKHIMADCDSAALKLPEATGIYKVNRYAALALKSRACLFEGTFRKYHAGTVFNPDNLPYREVLQAGADAALEVMTKSSYGLYSQGSRPYYDLFTLEEADPKEVILARCYAGNFSHLADAFALVPSKGRAGYTKSLVFSYLMKDGSRFTDKDGYDKMTFTDEVKDRDPRLSQTVMTQNFKYADGGAGVYSFTNTITGYPLAKFISGNSASSKSTVDMPVFRMAEVYLNYAEAKAELGTLNQEDIDKSINLLRDRVGMAHMDMAAVNANPDDFLMTKQFGYVNVDKGSNCGVILEIRRERSIELVSEGFRYFDILRWREGHLLEEPFYGPYIPGPGKYDMDGDGKTDFVAYSDHRIPAPGVIPLKINQDIFLSNGDSGYIKAREEDKRVFNQERDYLFPIPINDRTLSNGRLTQNPGWNDGLSF